MKKLKIIFGIITLEIMMGLLYGCAHTQDIKTTKKDPVLQRKIYQLEDRLVVIEAKLGMVPISAVAKKRETPSQVVPAQIASTQANSTQDAPAKVAPKESEPLACSQLSDLKEGQLCKVSTGKCFKIVANDLFAIGIQEMSNPKNPKSQDCKHPGMIWAHLLRKTNVNFNQAHTACPQGSHLPKKEDFVRLRDSMSTVLNVESIKFFDPKSNHNRLTEEGKKDLYSLLPDLKDHWFWLASSVDSYKGFGFSGNDGGVDDNYRSDNTAAARCVQRMHEKQVAQYVE